MYTYRFEASDASKSIDDPKQTNIEFQVTGFSPLTVWLNAVEKAIQLAFNFDDLRLECKGIIE